jgi:serine/threonine protein phosphatase PrpC
MIENGFDVHLSGSTVCALYFEGTYIHCANAGDSRAILVQIPPYKNTDSSQVLNVIN